MQRLAEVAMVVTGIAPESAGARTARFIQIKDLDPTSRSLAFGEVPSVKRALRVQAGDVLVAARGERASAVQADDGLLGAYVGLDVYLIRPDPQHLDAGYLSAFLNLGATAALLRTATTGAALPRVPKEALAELMLPVPSLEKQRAIGALASAISDHSALLTRLAKANARLGESLVDRAFAALFDEVN